MDRNPREHLPLVLRCKRWDDPHTERIGFPVRSTYTETFWLPVIGPTATLLARRLSLIVGHLVADPADVDALDLALSLGLPPSLDRYAMLARTLRRLIDFGFTKRYGEGGYLVRTYVEPLPWNHRERLPADLRVALDRVPAKVS